MASYASVVAAFTASRSAPSRYNNSVSSARATSARATSAQATVSSRDSTVPARLRLDPCREGLFPIAHTARTP